LRLSYTLAGAIRVGKPRLAVHGRRGRGLAWASGLALPLLAGAVEPVVIGVVVELTEPGSQLEEQAVAAAAEAQGTLLSGLTVQEVKTLGRLLRKMQSGLTAGTAPPIG
jgi:hypothetical protein